MCSGLPAQLSQVTPLGDAVLSVPTVPSADPASLWNSQERKPWSTGSSSSLLCSPGRSAWILPGRLGSGCVLWQETGRSGRKSLRGTGGRFGTAAKHEWDGCSCLLPSGIFRCNLLSRLPAGNSWAGSAPSAARAASAHPAHAWPPSPRLPCAGQLGTAHRELPAPRAMAVMERMLKNGAF